MNSLGRILATIPGKETDVVPFTLLLSLYGASLIKSDTTSYYRDPELWFMGQQKVIDLFDPDIVITPFSFPIEAEAFGSELTFLNKYAPNVKKPIITDLSQIDQLTTPNFETSASIQFFLKAIDLFHENYGEQRAIGTPIHSPADFPALLMGIEKWIDTLFFHPKAVDDIMQKTIKHFINLGNEFFKRGATFLIVPVNFTTPMIITENIFKKLIPYLEFAFSSIKGPIVIHNGGAKLLPFLHHFAKLPNVIAFVLEPSESFDEARNIIGDELVLMGNIDGPDLINLNTETVAEKTLKILNNRKNDKHFIFASSNADIPYDTPPEIIHTIVSTIRNFKKH